MTTTSTITDAQTESDAQPNRVLAGVARAFHVLMLAATWITCGLAVLVIVLTTIVGVKFDKVVTGSMEPAIMTGEYIVVLPLFGDTPAVGEVASFQYGNISVVHRIHSVDEHGVFTTKGDNNPVVDSFKTKLGAMNGTVAHVVQLPEAALVSLFITSTDWRADAFTTILDGDWDELPAVLDGAPWGTLSLFGGLVVLWVIDDLFVRAVKRSQRPSPTAI